MTEKKEYNWKFVIYAANCTGALTSIAAAFSNENVNIKDVTARETSSPDKSTINISFKCTEDQKDILVRKIKRLTKVIELIEGKN